MSASSWVSALSACRERRPAVSALSACRERGPTVSVGLALARRPAVSVGKGKADSALTQDDALTAGRRLARAHGLP